MRLASTIFSLLTLINYSAKAQNFEWAKILPSTIGASCEKVTVDDSGNIYIAGIFYGTSDFDPGPGVFNLTTASANERDIFVCKLDSLGNFKWAVRAGNNSTDAESDKIIELQLGNSGEVLVVGRFVGTVDFNTGPGVLNFSCVQTNGFLLNLNNNGTFNWAKQIGHSPDPLYACNMNIDPAGNIYVIGDFLSAADFDPGPATLYVNDNNGRYFIQKLSPQGTLIWVKTFGFGTIGVPDPWHAMVIDDSSNVYSTGYFSGTTDFDPGPGTVTLTSLGGLGPGDEYISKIDSSGNLVWVRGLLGDNAPTKSIKLDQNNNLLVSGTFAGTIDFDPGPANMTLTTFIQLPDMFTAKYSSSGNLIWVSALQTPSNGEYPLSMTVDTMGNSYTIGRFAGTIDFDNGPLTCNLTAMTDGVPDISDHFILKLDSTGKFIWAKQLIGDKYINRGYDIVIDHKQNIYCSGSSWGTIDFDPGIGSSLYSSPPSSSVGFLLKFSQDVCSDFFLVIDSVSNVLCSTPGYASCHVYNAHEPYQYEWNTNPVTSDSIVSFNTFGLYSIMCTDDSGCVTMNQVLVDGPDTTSGSYDLSGNLVTTGAFQPGVNTNIWVHGHNNTCDTVSGLLMLILDPLTTYDSATVSPTSISGDTLIWQFSSMDYDISVATKVFVTTSTSAQIGDTVCFSVLITPVAGDMDSSNNTQSVCLPVVNSYDPNIKQITPEGICAAQYIQKDETLTYTIHFQNMGTASAINIYILDTLDANLDINTLNFISASDNVITEILPGNVLYLRFNNIYLPHALANEPNSHGYYSYSILASPSVLNGTVVNNTAYIYFDYNFPIVTNTLSNALVDSINNLYYSNTVIVNLLCGSNYVFPDGSSITSITSDFTQVSYLTPTFGCDSVITTNIIITALDTAIMKNLYTLTATSGMSSYQWIDCNNNYLPISGETNPSFTATSNGNYAVIITNGSCSDTSACHTITGIGINEADNHSAISIFPNPGSNSTTVTSSNSVIIEILLKDIYGRTINAVHPNLNSAFLPVDHLATGIYYITVITNHSNEDFTFIKQ